MTGYFVKAAALALAVAVLAGLLKGRQASLAAALTLGGCAALFYFAALLLQPVRSFCSELAQTAGVAEAYLRPVLKCTGIALLTEAQYRALQELGEFDVKTSSWIETPVEVRALGGALFCDRRFNRVFTFHNGAESYYASRGFRGSLRV